MTSFASYKKPLGIVYEQAHAPVLKPFFLELEQRRIPFVRINVAHHQFNPAERQTPYSLVVNLTGLAEAAGVPAQRLSYTSSYLAHLEHTGVPVINNVRAQRAGSGKARQLALLAQLQLPFPRARIVNDLSQVVPAVLSLRFPVVIEANTGGQPLRFESLRSVEDAVSSYRINLGTDHSAVIREYIYPEDNFIYRVETLGGRVVSAQRTREDLHRYAHDKGDVYRQGYHEVGEVYQPADPIIREVELLVQAACLDHGAVEYVIDASGDRYYLGIDTRLRTFATNGTAPEKNFVDYIEQRLRQEYPAVLSPYTSPVTTALSDVYDRTPPTLL
jgi:hypothetical protein